MKLNAHHLDHFETEGYVIVESALENADIDPVIADYSAFIDRRSRELHAAGQLSDIFEDEPFKRRLARICEEDVEIYDDIDIMHFRGAAVFDFLRNDNLMDVVEGLVGPEITCSPIQHARAKLPGCLIGQLSDAAFDDERREKIKSMVRENVAPWHQDAQVHLEEADPTFILTVWIPLCDATVENGCMEIIPRVHCGEVVYWSEGFGISDDNLPAEAVVPVPVHKGDVLFLHKLIPHRSTPNYTDGIRWSLDLRYQETGTPTGRAFYPDFPTRSRSNPASVLTDHAEWCRLWIEALEKVPTDRRPARQARPQSPIAMARGGG